MNKELIEAYKQGQRDALMVVLSAIQQKKITNTDDLIPALLVALKEYADVKTIQ